MIPELVERRNRIAQTRRALLAQLDGLSPAQDSWHAEEATWSLQEVVEHLVLAERGGFHLTCSTADGYRAGTPVREGAFANAGRSIEESIAATWEPKEKAPPGAQPEGKSGAWAREAVAAPELRRPPGGP
ncbi:MAG TPA: hypothetical protein VLA43_14560 [Longimicrobiales bacterium]|nr:hypothetical protein [Longimicrobiales bacterium]